MPQRLVALKRLLPSRHAARIDALFAGASAEQLSAGRTAVTAFSLRVAGAAIAYLSQIVLARWMGIHEYGIFVVVTVWITVLSQIGNLGFSSSVIRFVPEYRARGDRPHLLGVMRASRIFAIGFATLLAGGGVLGLVLVPDLVDHHYVVPIYLGAICLPLFCLTEVQDGIARSFDWSDLAFGPTYIWRPIGIMAAMVVAHELQFPMTAATACISAIVATWITALVQLLLIHGRTRKTVGHDTPAFQLRHWLVVSLPILLSDGFYALLTSVDVIMVSHFGSPTDVAIYYAATKTLALVHFVYYAVRAAAGPRYSYAFHSGDLTGLRTFVGTSVRWTFWPSVATATIVLALGDVLLSLFGAEFTGGSGILLILVVGILARASVGPVETLLTMAGHQTTVAAIFAAAFAVNLVLNIVLIPVWGVAGAAVGTASAMIVETILVLGAVKRHFGFAVWVFRMDALTRGRTDDEPSVDDPARRAAT